VGVWVPLGSAERTFATAILAVAVGAFGKLDSPCQRGARRQATRCASLVDPAWQSVRSSELGGVDRPSTGPRIDATSTRTPEKEAHLNRQTKQRVLTPFLRRTASPSFAYWSKRQSSCYLTPTSVNYLHYLGNISATGPQYQHRSLATMFLGFQHQ